jgi:hypothetical protein
MGETTIRIACLADIDLPGDRCRLVRRLAQRIAEREAGPELADRVRRLGELGGRAVHAGRSRISSVSAAGRNAVLSGRGKLSEIVGKFIEEVCR